MTTKPRWRTCLAALALGLAVLLSGPAAAQPVANQVNALLTRDHPDELALP